jgi:hypothetical protein
LVLAGSVLNPSVFQAAVLKRVATPPKKVEISVPTELRKALIKAPRPTMDGPPVNASRIVELDDD